MTDSSGVVSIDCGLNGYVAKRTGWFDPRDTEIKQLHRLLSEAKDALARTETQRVAAAYERDIALRALTEIVQHFINAPTEAAEPESCPALDAIRATQINNRVR